MKRSTISMSATTLIASMRDKARVQLFLFGLVAGVSLTASHALAQDVQLGGNDTSTNNVVAACTSLVEQVIPTPAAGPGRFCIATGSSDALNPDVQGTHQYAFELTVGNVICDPIDGGSERMLEFNNVNSNFEWDNKIKEITSTRFFYVAGQAAPVVRWTAEPLNGAPALTVDDSSLTVVCSYPGNARLPYTPIPD